MANNSDDARTRLTEPSLIAPPPSSIPQPTGNFLVDTGNSLIHVLETPCSRNAFMQGIMGGFGMGFLRGMSAPPIIAGHWAIGTFTAISTFSWYMCQKRIAQDRERVSQMMSAAQSRPKAN
ncbi:hypothetical protein CYLTODRAFT_425193 [Cylindrobasidium torrendii FP15055 ss-10]|uniref:Cytochrome c oxidase assembly protein COX20, mitochondrial n=1 Tax=Cylindrobasidium torrendii FP15055 ss-10 TaxID=1314674 RepID=A0A0D7B2P6_9AGAR|nr:hypothetical protein CYLTODRAFT_425193 [Cylindrobasidium torrendii FP15055 ss-10]